MESQRNSIDEHAVLTTGLLQFPLVQGTRVVITWCLRANLIALWLAMVLVKRLKAEKQQRILRYQQQVADVLDRLFGVGPDAGTPVSGDPSAATEVAPAYAEGLAIARMASEQAQLALQTASAVDGRINITRTPHTAHTCSQIPLVLGQKVICENGPDLLDWERKLPRIRASERPETGPGTAWMAKHPPCGSADAGGCRGVRSVEDTESSLAETLQAIRGCSGGRSVEDTESYE